MSGIAHQAIGDPVPSDRYRCSADGDDKILRVILQESSEKDGGVLQDIVWPELQVRRHKLLLVVYTSSPTSLQQTGSCGVRFLFNACR
jgi:hypothetical protein